MHINKHEATYTICKQVFRFLQSSAIYLLSNLKLSSLSLSVYICIHTHTHRHTSIYIYIYVQFYIICLYLSLHLSLSFCICIYIHTHTYISVSIMVTFLRDLFQPLLFALKRQDIWEYARHFSKRSNQSAFSNVSSTPTT